jgi:glycosyltransferase involved in cell wall biosynthesis
VNRPFTIVSNQGALGGGEVMLLNLAAAARELDRDVTVVGPADPGELLAMAEQKGFRTVAVHGRGKAGYLANLRRWDAAERRGLLWCNGLRPALATAGHPDRVVHLHQEPTGPQQALAAIARAGALDTIVPSSSMAEATPGATVLWNWTQPVPLRTVRPRSARATLGFIGRLWQAKGILVLAAALRELDRRHPGRFRLLVAGEPRFVPPQEAARIDDALTGLGNLVEIRGWMDRDAFFSEIDCAVIPSIGAESFGLVAAEAMAARCPFVISSAGALPEVAGAGYPFVAATGDALSLADAIESALAVDSELVLDASRQRWERHFSPDAGRARLEAALHRLDPGPETATAPAPKVVLAHDYLTQRGGAERVVSCLADAFPRSPIVTSLHNPDDTFPEFDGRAVVASPLNLSWLMRHRFRLGLPLYGWIFEHARLPRDTDVVVASSTGFAHGVRTPPGTRKIVYCHSPARFLYLMDDYLGGPWWHSPQGWALKALRPVLVAWDQRAATTADRYLCNSSVVRERIRRVYGIDATVVSPPHSLDPTGPQEPVPGLTGGKDANGNARFFLAVSRLMPYKNVHVLLRTFAELPDEHLVVVGKGDSGHPAALALRPRRRRAGPQQRGLRPHTGGGVQLRHPRAGTARRWLSGHRRRRRLRILLRRGHPAVGHGRRSQARVAPVGPPCDPRPGREVLTRRVRSPGPCRGG